MCDTADVALDGWFIVDQVQIRLDYVLSSDPEGFPRRIAGHSPQTSQLHLFSYRIITKPTILFTRIILRVFDFLKLKDIHENGKIKGSKTLTLTLPGPSAGVSGSLDSYCSLKPLCSGMGEVVPARTSPTLLPPSPRTMLSLSCFKVSQCINCRD